MNKKKKKHKKKNSKKKQILNNQIWMYISIVLFIIILFILLFFHLNPRFSKQNKKTIPITTLQNCLKENYPEFTILDDNYVFLGDSITHGYPLKNYYHDLPVIRSGIGGYTTAALLNNIETMLYQYNPTKVFILIGTNDYLYHVRPDEIQNNIEKIIKDIKKNRPYTKIYIESILPVNTSKNDLDGRNNETIKETNRLIQKLCTKYSVTYIDLFSKMIDEQGSLKLKYTYDGLHLTEEGYRKMTEIIFPYLED